MAKEMNWSKVKGCPAGVYKVVFEAYSDYDGMWSVCERMIDAGSEDDARHWAKDFISECMAFWKKCECGNTIKISKIELVTKRPGFPSARAAKRELALEGYGMDD